MGYKFEVKPGKYVYFKDGKLNYVTFYVKLLKDDSGRKSINNISARWRLGKMRVDKSEFYSASFKQWIKLYCDGERYGFYTGETLPNSKDGFDHHLSEEVLEVVDAMLAEHALLFQIKAV
jgi:hypothetical protein